MEYVDFVRWDTFWEMFNDLHKTLGWAIIVIMFLIISVISLAYWVNKLVKRVDIIEKINDDALEQRRRGIQSVKDSITAARKEN